MLAACGGSFWKHWEISAPHCTRRVEFVILILAVSNIQVTHVHLNIQRYTNENIVSKSNLEPILRHSGARVLTIRLCSSLLKAAYPDLHVYEAFHLGRIQRPLSCSVFRVRFGTCDTPHRQWTCGLLSGRPHRLDRGAVWPCAWHMWRTDWEHKEWIHTFF